ncbi:piggyBac transposable element-derived protein 2-like [Xyrauchen texanus]|uniref:piggyBac transposable element-derived protein 2-like n=1 Tax=Xyrauchen texanus TaxID=154827 RepID=UPI0022428104|nr:piggyBac transposable element-derived protein 2-like [Xyrauchen texanus]
MKPSVFYGKRVNAQPHVRAPPEESEDSCLSDSAGSDEEYVPKPGDEESCSESDRSSSDEENVVKPGVRRRSSSSEEEVQYQDAGSDGECVPEPGDEESNRSSSDEEVNNTSAQAARKTQKRQNKDKVVWKTVKQTQSSTKKVPVWEGALPDSDTIKQPVDYFRQFFDTELLDLIVNQSNLYSTQENPNRALKLDQKELEQFIGTVLYMSVIRLPHSRIYWSNAFRVEQVADVMPRGRWEEIKHFLHLNDNSAPNNSDRLFKIRPLIDSLLSKFQALPQDQMLSIDEQMVPFKGRSVLKQYIPKKPYKWGYKIFVLCDTKGLVHSFDVYAGKSDPPPGSQDIGSSGNFVLKLAQVIEGSVNHLLFFDNWFSLLDLFVALAKRGIPALGTVQQNRLPCCSFSEDKKLKKKGRGTFEEQQAVVDRVDRVEVRAVKWFDNRGVIVASTFASAQPVSFIERWDRKQRRKVSVECPSIITLYNKFMGGVDALDALIAYYRIHIRSKKYYHRFFFHFVDMVVVNGWLLYRRNCDSMNVPRKKQKDLLAFKLSIAQALCMQGKDLSAKKRGRRSSDVEREFKKKRRGPTKAIPTQDVRADGVGHWPQIDSVRQRCKFPKCTGHTSFKCTKCDVHLCLNKNKNCFCAFHE